MSRYLNVALAVAALAFGRAAYGQDARVHVIRSRPYDPADTTGLVHAPRRLTEVRTLGVARDAQNCAQHLRDGALNIDLLLVASFARSTAQTSGDTVYTYRSTYGDYAPKTRRAYGLLDGELVRVDCSRDRPVGKVRTRSADQLR